MQENFIYRMNQKLFNQYQNRDGWILINQKTLINDQKNITLKKDNRVRGTGMLEVSK